MAATVVSLTIPEAEAAKTKLAAELFTGNVGAGPTPKQLLAAVVNQMVIQVERSNSTFASPGIT